ncbi:MAG: 4'-phosphopantetheinyl transferase superfamily protein, partial [Eubacterium sp.]|nr:4'-phosphopantetheinyl transferase superfamily protein [Candidatus Colimonas fimequi]
IKGSELTDQLIADAVAMAGYDPEAISVSREDSGKPVVFVAGDEIHVSCSHSLDSFACVVAASNCGVDIQEPKKIKIWDIARRYFTDEEQEYVGEHGLEGFYKIWTRREAYAKYTGVGLRQVMSDVSVLNRDDVTFEDSVLDNGMYCSICY